ncbi:MAG: cytochrome c oxidase subunit 3 [Saprospiraceae bacterium]
MDVVANSSFRQNKIPPLLFALWVACASIGMMFAAFTSAYIVRQGAGNWLEFAMPHIFYVSAGVMLISSITLQLSYSAFKKENTLGYRLGLIATFILGFIFIGTQYQGWLDLAAIGVELTTNPSGSFVYVISGIHAAHVLGGIGILIVALLHAFMLPHKVTTKRTLRFRLTLTYWHFVDALWLYLLFFFTLYR